MRTSYSALATFEQCPQKFKFQEIDKIRAPKSVEALFGTSVHSALKYMFSHDPLFPTLDEVLASFGDTWKTASAKISPALAPEAIATYEDAGKRMIKNFYAKNPPWNFSVVDTESRFEVALPDPISGEGHVLAGIIDRIDNIGDGEYEIVDYKTARRLPAQADVDGDLQMSLYHMALMRKWPDTKPANITLSLYFLKHGQKISSRRTAESLAHTSEAVLAAIRHIQKSIAANSFEPQPSALCDYCPYKKICPAWKHLYKKEAVDAPDEQLLAASLREYFAIKETEEQNEERLKELQGVIRAYMDANHVDRVFDERGYYVARKLQQRFGYDLDAVKNILTSAGLSELWTSLLEADEKKLKAILKKLPPDVQQKIESAKILEREFTTLTTSTKPVKK